jgi:hypothetical protein
MAVYLAVVTVVQMDEHMADVMVCLTVDWSVAEKDVSMDGTTAVCLVESMAAMMAVKTVAA